MKDINELTIGEAKELLKLLLGNIQPDDSHWEIGKIYLVRTVTMIQAGTLKKVAPSEIILENAVWVADTGRFSDSLQTGDFSEMEPFNNDVIIGRGAIVDAVQILKFKPFKK